MLKELKHSINYLQNFDALKRSCKIAFITGERSLKAHLKKYLENSNFIY